jgi:acetate kinase
MHSLIVNVGSSSVRLALYDSNGERLTHAHFKNNKQAATDLLSNFLRDVDVASITAIAHRIVHGGERFTQSCVIDADVEQAIADLSSLAPLHNLPALTWIRACRERFGMAVPQVAVFDTAFYNHLPAVARSYAIPHELATKYGLRRFGFHGIAHRAMWQQWTQSRVSSGRVISLQLGSGCSITAIRDGRPVDTSMGFSPLEGLMMATRPGDLDAGVLLHLQRAMGCSLDQLEHLLNERCGLLGVSGSSADLSELLTMATPQSELAVELYCYRARKFVGAYLAAMGGADAVLFGGGVGEHLPTVRAKILHDMHWAGIVIDADKNAAAVGVAARIDATNSKLEVHVAPVDEEQVLMTEAQSVLVS